MKILPSTTPSLYRHGTCASELKYLVGIEQQIWHVCLWHHEVKKVARQSTMESTDIAEQL
jgi:hypothetical protein